MQDTSVPDRGDQTPRIPQTLDATDIAPNHAELDRPRDIVDWEDEAR